MSCADRRSVDATAAAHLGAGAGPGAIGAGMLLAAFGVGDLLGSTMVPRLTRRFASPQLVAAGLAVIGAGLLCAAIAPLFALVLAGVALAGLGDGVSVVADQCLLQQRVPESHTGRVAATYEATLTTASMTAPLSAGALRPRPAYAIAALPCVAAAILYGTAVARTH